MVTRLLLLLLFTSGCSLIRDLDYLGNGGEETLPDLCPGGGWCPLPDSKLRGVCPDSNAEHDYNYTCPFVIGHQSGGVYDSAGHRLILFGGGSGLTSHYGNEVYALSLVEGAMQRLTDPSPTPECVSELPDGTPHPRASRDTLAMVDGGMLAVGSETVCGFLADTWWFDLATLTWTNMAPAGPEGCDPALAGSCHPSSFGIMADYDPVTGAVFAKDNTRFWRYDKAANRYEQLRDNVPTSYAMTGRIDPERRLFVYVGCMIVAEMCVPSIGAISIDPATQYSNSDWTDEQSGCEPLMERSGPGFSYDARQKVFVGWPNEGNTVYQLDPATKTCTPLTFEGGPPPIEQGTGTWGRFRYMPELDAFIVVNHADNDAYVLRL